MYRKRAHSVDTTPHARPSLASAPSLPSPTQPAENDTLAGVDWDAFLGQDFSSDPITGGVDYALDGGAFPQSTGAVLGSVDFGALFGLGDPGSEGARPWSPALHGNELGALLAGPPASSSGGTHFAPDEWSGTAFDLR